MTLSVSSLSGNALTRMSSLALELWEKHWDEELF
jgi:hypothetical protein